MEIISFADLFKIDLGDFIFKKDLLSEDGVFASAKIWNPLLVNDGSWACKCLLEKDQKEQLTVMPGIDPLDSLLRIAKYLHDVEENSKGKGVLATIPKITFKGEF